MSNPDFARPKHKEAFTFRGHVMPARIASIKVRGEELLDAFVPAKDDEAVTAQDIADAVDANTAESGFTGRAVGQRVFIVAGTQGEEANGANLDIETTGEVSIVDVLPMAGGVAQDKLDAATSDPGSFVKTYGSKLYSPSGSVLYFSGIGEPTLFTPQAVGAGFIDMTTYATGAQNIVALENYYDQMVIFSESVIQLWSLDPDPDQNRQTQVLNNEGTRSPDSVAGVGDTDLFFLSATGINSLRPRNDTALASVADASLPIDDVVQEAMDAAGDAGVRNAKAIVEPDSKRYWLAIGTTLFVLSRYPGSNISAWSIYELDAPVDDFVRFNNRVYVRVGNSVRLYGGADGQTYDDAKVTVRIPYLDAQRPADPKFWNRLNIASEGEWLATVLSDPDAVEEQDHDTEVFDVTYGRERFPLQVHSTHISLRLEHEEEGPAKISNLALHYEPSDD